MSNVEIQPGEYADLMPDMSEEEYDALKASIERDGLRHPIEVTPGGVILDGHHRHRACQELGVEPEFVTVDGATVEQAIRANFTRRNLNDGAKREVVETYLENHWDGDATQAEIADALGVSQPTVSRAMENYSPHKFSTEEKRQQVAEYIDRHPEASNREVARSVEADVSHATVGNWRGEWEDDAEEESDAPDEPDTNEPEAEDPPAEPDAEESDAEEASPEAEEDAGEPDGEDGDPEPTEPDGDDADESDRLGKALDRIAELEAQLEEAEAENEQPREQDDGDASVKVLRRKLARQNSRVDELEAVIRRFLRAVENEDPEAIREAADEAEALLDD